jgi:hypothetical protein
MEIKRMEGELEKQKQEFASKYRENELLKKGPGRTGTRTGADEKELPHTGYYKTYPAKLFWIRC